MSQARKKDEDPGNKQVTRDGREKKKKEKETEL